MDIHTRLAIHPISTSKYVSMIFSEILTMNFWRTYNQSLHFSTTLYLTDIYCNFANERARD